MLLAAVIACLGSFSVATAADYAVNSADEFVTAWNQAAASNEASTITITVPSGSDNITLTGHLFCRETGAVRHFFPGGCAADIRQPAGFR